MFEIAAGSVLGSNHKWDEKNNQDAFHCLIDDKYTIAVVCDGCSEGKHSEIGARIGSMIVANNIRQALDESYIYNLALSGARITALQDLKAVIRTMSTEHTSQLVNDYFLFTVVGVIISEHTTMVFSLGDGAYALNGKITRLGPFPNNAPPYLAYGGLVESSIQDEQLVRFQVYELLETRQVESIMIGTDGIIDFINAENQNIPGKTDKVGPLSQFWTENKYFTNKDMVRRKLYLTNKAVTRPIWSEQRMATEKGLLPDDTTLVVMRRKQEPIANTPEITVTGRVVKQPSYQNFVQHTSLGQEIKNKFGIGTK